MHCEYRFRSDAHVLHVPYNGKENGLKACYFKASILTDHSASGYADYLDLNFVSNCDSALVSSWFAREQSWA